LFFLIAERIFPTGKTIVRLVFPSVALSGCIFFGAALLVGITAKTFFVAVVLAIYTTVGWRTLSIKEKISAIMNMIGISRSRESENLCRRN
jgi:hypothetical protein